MPIRETTSPSCILQLASSISSLDTYRLVLLCLQRFPRCSTPYSARGRLQTVRSFTLLGEYLPPHVIRIGLNIRELTALQLHVLVSWSISLGGVIYWYWWVVWSPRRGHYVLVRDWVRDDDGSTRRVVTKVKGVPSNSSLDWPPNREHGPHQPGAQGVYRGHPPLHVEIPPPGSPVGSYHGESGIRPSIPTPRSTPFSSSFPSNFFHSSTYDAEEDLDAEGR